MAGVDPGGRTRGALDVGRCGVAGRGLVAVATLLLALLMAVPATAAAEGPEFGRCIEEKKGNFDDAACTTASAKPGKGSFEWVPGVVKPQFTQMMPSEAAMDLDAGPRNLLTVICWGERDSGTFTGSKSLTLRLTFTECSSHSKVPCTSAGQPSGTIVTSTLQGQLGVVGISPQRPGIALTPTTGTFAEFECSPALKAVVRGAVIGKAGPENVMTNSLFWYTVATSTGAVPERIDGGPPTYLEGSVNGSPFERCSFLFKMTLSPEEEIEIRMT